MRRLVAVLFVVALAFTMVAGCAGFGKWSTGAQTAIDSVKTTNWAAVANWYDKAVAGLSTLAKVANVFLPQYKDEIGLATAAIAASKTGVDTLSALVVNAQAGTATEADLVAAANTLDAKYKEASNSIGQIIGKSPEAVAATKVNQDTTTAVPTPAVQ